LLIRSDSVLDILAEPLLECSYHVLTFNCRGVGKSSGWPSFTGLSEVADLREMVQWALQTVPNVGSLVIIVSLRVLHGTDVRRGVIFRDIRSVH
jgi:alpha/beta superfamily hydrolase